MSKNVAVMYPRIAIALAAAVIPILLFARGIFGSFLFTFSVPLFWHVGVRGESINSLGVNRKMLTPAILVGSTTGLLLGLLGGMVLKRCGMTGHAYTDLHTLNISLASINVTFTLQKELGYQLLLMNRTWGGGLLFLLFCVFMVGIGEELFWRGFVQQKFSHYMTKPRSIWLTAVLFGMVHCYLFAVLPMGTGVLFLALIALAGAFWGYLFERFGSLWAPALSHGIAAFIIWKYYFFSAP
jgi:membrane protease YdiL (CAAX protease family)